MHTPERRLNFADWGTYTVPAGQTVHACHQVELVDTDSNGDEDYPNARETTATSTIPLGIAKGDPGTTYTAGQQFDVLHYFNTVQWVRVGAAGATRGSLAVTAADGRYVNAGAHATTARAFSPGIFLQTGVAGDVVALGIAPTVVSTA